MKTPLLLLFTILSSVFCSCSNNPENTTNGKAIQFGDANDINATQIAETSYIKLQTTEDCIIGTINQIAKVGNKIFIEDGQNKCLYAFDANGNFISTIGRRGNGPGEYILPTSFTINIKENRIGIIDAAKQTLLNFSLDSLEFISAQKIGFSTSCFEKLSDGNRVWNNQGYKFDDINADSYFIVSDSANNVLCGNLKKKFKSGYGTGPTRMIYKLEEKVFAYTQLDPNIYEIQSDGATPVYSLQFGKLKLPTLRFMMDASNGGNDSYFSKLINSEYISYYEVYETKNDLCVFYIATSERYIGFYEKNSDQTYLYKLSDFGDQLNIKGLSYISSGTIDDYYVSPLFVTSLKLMQKDEGYKFNNELNELINKSGANDNPILFLFKLK